jgi:hypothetical protein
MNIIIIKTPSCEDNDSLFEFRVGRVPSLEMFGSSVPYEDKVRNLRNVDDIVVCAHLDEVEFVLLGVALALKKAPTNVLRIKFPLPYDELIQPKSKQFDDVFKNPLSEFSKIFGGVFK